MSLVHYNFSTIEDGNIAFHVTDDKDSVIKNRKNVCKKYGYNFSQLKYMDQIHSNKVSIVTQEQNLYKNCDALITNVKNTPLMVMVADCIPILFFTKQNDCIAVAHAGRNGTYQDIVSNVIDCMVKDFHIKIDDINIILGPSIKKCCYEVNTELALIAKSSFGETYVKGRFVDLQAINKKQLLHQGILEENITIDTTCTKCGNKNYYSYRKDKNCGRFCGIIEIQ